MAAICSCIDDEARLASRGQSELGEDRHHSRDASTCGKFYFLLHLRITIFIIIFLENGDSPVPVSDNKTEREGSQLLIDGELRADKVRDVSFV